MEKMLQGKIALVTGAARGIGRCIAVKLAEYGADVIVNDLKIDEDAPVLSEIRAQGVRAMALPGDITDCAKVNEMVDKAVAEMGRIDVLVNNAGAYPALGVLDVTEDHFNFVVNVNLKGLFFMTQAVVKKSMIPNNYAVSVKHADDIRCYGYVLDFSDERIYYSGDSYEIPSMIVKDFFAGKIQTIYQDTTEFSSDHLSHCPLSTLENVFPIEKRKDIYCMHFSNDFLKKIEEKGFKYVQVKNISAN